MTCCQRPGCSHPAVGRIGFDAAAAVLVIDGFIDVSGAVAVLCEVHLERMTAPKGWTIDDQRVGQRSLFRRETASVPRFRGGVTTRPASEATVNATVTKIGDCRSRARRIRRADAPTLPLYEPTDLGTRAG